VEFEIALVSLFIAYHLTSLLVYSGATLGFGTSAHAFLRRYLQVDAYMAITGNLTRWEMFAPDPPRANPFVRVVVEDATGQREDLHFDVYGRRQYPYLFFDRLAKINAWVVRKPEMRTVYAAWACREWERTHGGEPARRVRLENFHTDIPAPDVAQAMGGYHPMLLEVHETGSDTFDCATLPHGQLSPVVRARHGLPPAPEGTFRDVAVTTWWHQGSGAVESTPGGHSQR
jgi:hypothetical protein